MQQRALTALLRSPRPFTISGMVALVLEAVSANVWVGNMLERLSQAVVILLMILLTFAVPLGNILAKGPPDTVVITGPGLTSPIVITNPSLLRGFGFYSFEDVNRRIAEPKDPGPGYVITRYLEQGSDLTARDRAIYHLRPSGEPGLVFYEGLIDENMWSEFDGYWYHASEAGDATIRSILNEHGIVYGIDTSSSVARNRLSEASVLVTSLVILVIVVVASIMVRKGRAKRMSHRTSATNR